MAPRKQNKEVSPEEQQQQLLQAKKITRRRRKIAASRDHMLDFTELTAPDIEDPEDSDRSAYIIRPHHKLITDTLEKVEKGEILRLIITMPPQNGKSQLASRNFPAWCIGRNPYWNVILSSYNQTFAEDFGRDVKRIMETTSYRQIFPGVDLRADSKSASRLRTKAGGQMVFVGAGGSITGRPADITIIDDPLKGAEEADSPLERDKIWKWYSSTVYGRQRSGTRIIIIMTRWHEDDLVGRLTDPENDHYDPEEAKCWTILNLPALAEHDDPLGRPAMQPNIPISQQDPACALWPERFGLALLESAQRINPRSFLAQQQQRPSAEEGNFFKRDRLMTYQPNQLPPNLRYYAASDHAVGTAQHNDWTVLIVVGVDSDSNIWIVDVWRDKQDSDVVVEAIFTLMKRYKEKGGILAWWAERGHISKSIGPFLNKRMIEESCYVNVEEITPVRDKKTRAQSIQARTNMKKVYFPKFASWWPDALSEMLKFRGDGGTHDDFVDALAYIGLGLDFQYAASAPRASKPAPKPGTMAWMIADTKRKEQAGRVRKGSLR